MNDVNPTLTEVQAFMEQYERRAVERHAELKAMILPRLDRAEERIDRLEAKEDRREPIIVGIRTAGFLLFAALLGGYFASFFR